MRPRAQTISALFLAVVGGLLALPADADTMTEGIKAYNGGDYEQASRSFVLVAKRAPKNQIAHYYLANSLIYVNDRHEALREYEKAFRLDPFSQAGQYCKEALLAYKVIENDSRKKQTLPDDPKTVKQAVGHMRNQLERHKSADQAHWSATSNQVIEHGERQASRLKREMDDELAAVGIGTRRYRRFATASRKEISERYRLAQDGERQKARAQAAAMMKRAAQRAAEVENTATNLQKLIAEEPVPGHVKMKARGSNLYVRQYEFEEPPPVEPLMAKAKRMIPNGKETKPQANGGKQ